MMFCRSDDADTADSVRMPVAYRLRGEPIARANFIPLRLSMKQRKSQRLIRAITLASSYTDKVDADFAQPVKRDLAIVKEVLSAARGLVVALDLRRGAELMSEKDFTTFRDEITSAVEVSRRYKIMNPDLLRMDYVKFLYWIQDAVFSDGVCDALGFSIAVPILTVAARLEQLGAGGLLEDPRLPLCITPVPRIPSMGKLNAALRHKDLTVAALCKEYAQRARGGGVTADDIEACVRSLNDANNFDDDNADSAGELLLIFTKLFAPDDDPPKATNLAIVEGQEGSRLTHEHKKQFHFVVQSLSLWRLISRDMFRLWKLAEDDMLNPANRYAFRETGQGKQRVQRAPQLYQAVRDILDRAKAELGQWVGSERIHMGDDQVPNAFFFIDKYAQISRIIVPILRTVKFIERRFSGDDDEPPAAAAAAAAARRDASQASFVNYVKAVYGTPQLAQLAILRDFFRHGFDGSGGDNMDDAGSCIDGRLTSAWNWCNQISTKPYYPLFLLAGFQTFDGDLSL